MNLLHDELIARLLKTAGARTILEVGADFGAHTDRLQEYCREVGGYLTIIDIGPILASLEDVLDQTITTLHVRNSLDAIPELATSDAALLDGDHNYWTVIQELELLGERARADQRPLPLILVHDVWWPYGRRDMYYDASRVPDDHVLPSDKRGIAPGVSEKQPEGHGFNEGYLCAIEEGGPRNGVLTAVEDFVAKDEDRSLTVIPAMHGLAVVTTSATPESVLELLAPFDPSSPVASLLASVERGRVMSETKARNLLKASKREAERVQGLESQLANVSDQVVSAEQRRRAAEEALAGIRSHPVLRAVRPVRRAARNVGDRLRSSTR